MTVERGRPVSIRLAVAPARAVGLDGLFRRFPEGGCPGSDLVCERVPSVGDGHPIGECTLPCLDQTDDRKTAQTDVVPTSVYGDSLNPAFRAAGLDAKVEGASVPVPAGFGDRFCARGCQLSHDVPTSVPTFKLGN